MSDDDARQQFPTHDQLESLAQRLGVEVGALVALSTVEASVRGAFDAQGFPTVLFERHLFNGFTTGRYSGATCGLRDSTGASREGDIIAAPTAGGYGRYSDQKVRLAAAATLDRDAAQRAASWGLYQVLGDNWQAAGAASVQDFVDGMRRDVGYHVESLCSLLSSSEWRLALDALRRKDWARFARLYNGPLYARNQYDLRMGRAYDEYVREHTDGGVTTT